MLVIENRRRVEKRSTVPNEKPTIPSSNDHTDGSWSVTDIYEGEFFVNIPDGVIYTREGDSIIEVNLPNQLIGDSDGNVINGSDAVSFTVNSFDYRIKNRIYTHPNTSDEVTINNGDATFPRIDLIYIDENNAATYVA